MLSGTAGWIVGALIGAVVPIPIVGPFIQAIPGAFFQLYSAVAIGHLIGRLYYHTADRLQWF